MKGRKPEKFASRTDKNKKKTLWESEIAVVEIEPQNLALSLKLENINVSLRSSSHSKAKVKHELEKSERLTSDLFAENMEAKQSLDETVSGVESIQFAMLESKKTNILWKKNFTHKTLLRKRSRDSFNRKD